MPIFDKKPKISESDVPDVVVDFSFDQGLLFITVSNIGRVPACKVSVTFDKEIWGVEGEKLISDIALFRMIEFMPPGKQITTFLDTSASYFKRGQPTDIEANIDFQDRQSKTYTNKIKHNLEIYRDLGYVKR
jgi:hypothetical protein